MRLLDLAVPLTLCAALAAQDPAAGSRPAAAASRPADCSALLAPLVAEHGVPGMVAALLEGPRVAALGAAGVRRRGDPTPTTVDDRYHLGSCTKAMTATLCALLVEDGALRFDATLGDLCAPELAAPSAAPWRAVTLEQLLTNAGGVPTDLSPNDLWRRLWEYRGSPVGAREELLRGVAATAPLSTPGTTYLYSNAGFALAGLMAERAAKKPYETLLRERLFEPLGMASAGFGAPGSAGVGPAPLGHRDDGSPVASGPGDDNPEAITPAGRVHAAIGDWAKFVALHLRGASGRLRLKTETLARLHAPGPGRGADYAMGFRRAERPWADGPVLTHAGSNTMWYCVVWVAPRKDFAVLAACNRGGKAGERATDAAVAALIGKREEFSPRGAASR
jgi:CubicO group peptidase (beta-lactamase class C family)